MLLLQLPVLPVLLVLLLAAGCCSGMRVQGRVDSRSMLELTRRPSRMRTDTVVGLTGQRAKTPDRGGRSNHGPEGHLRDPRHKDKFIRHLTGPLYFHPKCKKHFHRLYHNTRDCTVPAYYKRCAVLLTQLANSPRCSER